MTALRFAVYAGSRGNYVFGEIAELLAYGLRRAGVRARVTDERAGFDRSADWHLIVGPEGFFYAGRGEKLRLGPWPPGVIFYDVEQRVNPVSARLRRLRSRAHAVWSLDRGAADAWIPLGWVSGCPLFKPVKRLARLPWPATIPEPTRAQPKPLDVLFLGGRSRRRSAFFKKQAPFFSRHHSLIRLVDDRQLPSRRDAPLHTAASLGLAQRAKIMLNVHQWGAFFEWHRVAVHGIAQGALVISEAGGDSYPLVDGRDFVQVPLEKIPEAVDYYLLSESGRREAERIRARSMQTMRSQLAMDRFLRPVLRALGAPRRTSTQIRAETAALLLVQGKRPSP